MCVHTYKMAACRECQEVIIDMALTTFRVRVSFPGVGAKDFCFEQPLQVIFLILWSARVQQ